ncbi:MAG: hypothetical protein IPK25_03435 [Saprospiraceae bacterium]|nr:hypothetical protein [Saprospiraceae bacterium]
MENYRILLEFIDYLILECINHNFRDSTRNLIWNISDNIQKQILNNCPKKESIIDIFEHETLEYRFNKMGSSSDSSQWRLISIEYPDRLKKILSLALQNNDGDLVHSLTMSSSTLCESILKSDLEDDLKGNFVWWHQVRITNMLIDWMSRPDSKIYAEHVSLIKPIEYKNEIIEAKAYIPRVLETYYNYLRDLIALGDLDYFLPVYRLHGVGEIACENFHTKRFHKRLLKYHLKYLFYFKNVLEKNLKAHYRAYDALKEEFTRMQKLISTINPVPDKILMNFNNEINKFRKTKKFKIGERIKLEKRD